MFSFPSRPTRFCLAATLAAAVVAMIFALPPGSHVGGQAQTLQAADKQNLLNGYRQLPLSFEAGREGEFVSHGESYDLSLTGGGATLRLGSSELRLELLNAGSRLQGEGIGQLPGKSNYLLGNDPRLWQKNVARFAKVRYREVWPGVDLVYYGNRRQLEYDFVVAPGADPAKIGLRFDGPSGSLDSVTIDAAGDLLLRICGDEVRMHRPIVYQQIGSRRQEVAGRYVINARQEVGFAIGEYDASKTLIIDPVLSYSALFDSEFITGLALDAEGAIYVTGVVRSAVFPISPNAVRTARGETNASAPFVAKLNPEGTALIYSTYIGGFSALDFPYGIAVDGGGNVYLAGRAGSAQFPVTPNAFQQTFVGPGQVGNGFMADGFVLKLNPTGTALIYSTFLGASSGDSATSIAVDSAGNAYVCGATGSSDFPVSPDAAQRTISGFSGSGFVTKLNADGSNIVWSTFVGRSTGDSCQAIAVDAQGNAFVTGSSFPSVFAAKVNNGGRSFGYHSRLTGSNNNGEGLGIAVDGGGNAYVTGRSNAGLPTTSGAFQRTYGGGGSDAFVAKFNSAGGTAYLSYLGGKDEDRGNAIAVDAAGNAYVTGFTKSDNFPTANAFQPNFGKPAGSSSSYQTAYVTKVNPNGSALAFSSYYGLGGDEATTIAAPKPGQVIFAGRGAALSSGATFSTNPTAFQSLIGATGTFITRIDENATGSADLTVSIAANDKVYSNTSNSYIVTVTNIGNTGSYGPIILGFNFNTNVNVGNVSGAGWYSFDQSLRNPLNMSFPGALGPGQSAKLLVEFGPRTSDNVSATASINNVSDGNASNNSATDTTAIVKGCFNGGTSYLQQKFPAEGGTFTHPVNISCPEPWKATSNASWITVNSGPATGNGSFSYTLAPNATASQRQGTIVFEGIALGITQDFLPGISNVSSASYGAGNSGRQTTLARESIVAMFGKDLATTTQIATTVPLPTTLEGTTVKIKDYFGAEHEAPIFFVSPTQINYLLPEAVATGYATLTITNGAGKIQTATIQVADLTPGLFSANASGSGVPAAVLLRVKADGSQSFEPVAEYDQARQMYVSRLIDFGPDPNDQLFLILFGTGFRNRSSLAKASVSNSASPLPALYAGPQGDFVGLDQVNVQLNRGMINYGTVYLVLYADGIPSNPLQIEFKR